MPGQRNTPTCFDTFQPLATIATTAAGINILQPLWQSDRSTLWIPEKLTSTLPQPKSKIQNPKSYQGALKDHLAAIWSDYQGFVFCLATGAVVRLIAPLLQHKGTDPAVVVVDQNGKFVISLCSGHQGGADDLANAVALQMGATPILTGGANGLNLPAIDTLGIPFGWTRGTGDWTGVSAAVARQEPVQVIQEAGSTLWQDHLPQAHPFQFGFPEIGDSSNPDNEQNLTLNPFPSGTRHVGTASPKDSQNSKLKTSPTARIWISPIQRRFSPESDLAKVQWHPRVLWIGVGCERGTSRQLIETAIQEVCRAHHLAEGSIAGIASLDLKADEAGILELCRDRNWAFRCFPADVLRAIEVPNPSPVVAAEVGTPSVAEAAALRAILDFRLPILDCNSATSNPEGSKIQNAYLEIQNPKSKIQNSLRVPKKVFRQPDQPGAVTVAIAQAEQEYTGRPGALWLVGMGPGELAQITPAAKTAINQADVVIGYSLYLDLIRSLLRPGQIVEASPITQERQRAERAIELAQWGLTVAVVSSGDCGIYGMAGLVLEQLRAVNWDGKTPDVQVFPGISALQAAASRVGAPLMHDFCAISLSDLLTPWEVIEKRLTAAAQADFITALYNPRSQTRTQQIAKAQQIFLQHRDAQTPVAVVRSAYRPDEQVMLTTLEQLLDAPIDMLTTVIIGNCSTRTYADWMITPRGYLGFGAE